MFAVRLSEDAQRAYDDAQAPLQRKLDRCFANLAMEPRRHPNIARLSGPLAAYHRYRVGDYRVVYRIDDGQRTVWVAEIEHRGEVYR